MAWYHRKWNLTSELLKTYSFIKRIKVANTKVELNYTAPAFLDKVTIDEDRVLPTVHDGGRYRT